MRCISLRTGWKIIYLLFRSAFHIPNRVPHGFPMASVGAALRAPSTLSALLLEQFLKKQENT